MTVGGLEMFMGAVARGVFGEELGEHLTARMRKLEERLATVEAKLIPDMAMMENDLSVSGYNTYFWQDKFGCEKDC